VSTDYSCTRTAINQ